MKARTVISSRRGRATAACALLLVLTILVAGGAAVAFAQPSAPAMMGAAMMSASDDAARLFVTVPGQPLRPFAGKSAAGEALTWPREGRVTLLHVVDCSSGRCGESTQAIESFVWSPLKDRAVDVIAIGRGSDAAGLSSFAASHALTYPLLPDADGAVASRFAPEGKGVPRTIIADASGTIVYQSPGFSSGREAEWRRVLESLLDGDSPRLATRATQMADINWVGRKAPEFVVENWANEPPADTVGKWQMLEFWATWCGPCVQVMPEIQKKHVKFGDRLVIKSVSGEDIDTVRAFVKKNGYTWPIGSDPSETTATAIGIMGIPHALLVDPDGIVRWEGHPAEFAGEDGEARLLKVIGGGSGS